MQAALLPSHRPVVCGRPLTRAPRLAGRICSPPKGALPSRPARPRAQVASEQADLSNVGTKGDPYAALKGKQAWLVSEQQRVDVGELWGEDERCVLVFARSFGCFFCQELARQLERDVLPVLDAAGAKLFLVSMGTPERGIEFSELTGYPSDRLIADPDSTLYKSVGFHTGLHTFFSPTTPFSLLDRIKKDGAKDLIEAFKSWKPWIPPIGNQAFQEGGCLVFEGENCLLAYYEEGPGTHVNFDVMMNAALDGAKN